MMSMRRRISPRDISVLVFSPSALSRTFSVPGISASVPCSDGFHPTTDKYIRPCGTNICWEGCGSVFCSCLLPSSTPAVFCRWHLSSLNTCTSAFGNGLAIEPHAISSSGESRYSHSWRGTSWLRNLLEASNAVRPRRVKLKWWEDGTWRFS
jgi:hypothetical protein